MKSVSKKIRLLKITSVVFLFAFLFSGYTLENDPISIVIDVAPNVLNLANQGEVVTIHTDIAYGAVEGATVTLNGLEIDWWKSDSRGYFVAKFEINAVKEMVEPGNCLLKLEGLTKNGEYFSGEQNIKVIEVVPSGKK